MKKFPFSGRLLAVAAAGAFSMAAFAATFSVGGVKYTSIAEPSGDGNGTCKVAWQTQGIEGVVTIPDFVTYQGKNYDVVEIADYAFNSYGDQYEIEITALHIGNNVTKIGRSCCADQVYLAEVTFGDALTTIGSSAFSECAIRQLTLPAGVRKIEANTFYNNNSLRSVTLNEGLESIGNFAFYRANNLTSIDIPASVTSIAFDRSAFADCTHLQAMNVAPGNTTYQSKSGIVYSADGTSLLFAPLELSAEHLEFPAELTEIGGRAFEGNKRIKTIAFPQALTTIGNDAFKGCSALTSITTPAALRTISEYAFADCTALNSVTLNEGLTTVGNSAFKQCTALTSFHIPASVTSFSWSALYRATGLRQITVAPGNSAYSSDGVALVSTQDGMLIKYAPAAPAKAYKTADNVRRIDGFAFMNIPALEVLDLNNASILDSDAIADLPALRDVTLGASVSELGGGAIELCPNLTTIRMYSMLPPTLTGTRDPLPTDFGTKGVLYVPDAAVANYKQVMYWNSLNIKPMSQAPEVEMPAGDAPVAHAYSMGSRTQQFGFVQFPADNVAAMTVEKTTTSGDDQIGAGEYVDGKYYSYTLYYDFIFGDGLEPSEFVVWNPETYTTIRTATPDLKGRVVDMAYDYVHNTMYALVEENRTDNGAIGLTALNVVDLQTGEMTRVGLPGEIKAQNGNGHIVDEHLIGLASRPSDGQLFAMGEYRQLYTLDRMTGLATAVGQRNKVAITNDFQSMAFDAQENLYQVQCHPDYEYFMRIDPATGALFNPTTGEPVAVNPDFTNNAAQVPNDAQLTGLYFTDKTFISDAPKPVANLAAAVASDNPNKVMLSWSLPTENHNGTPATITGVDVYRFGTAAPIATLGAGAVSYTDAAAPNGDVVYYIVAKSAAHPGFPAWTSVFAGADQLKSVGNLTAELDGNVANISWTAPTATVNGGYADYNNITYTVKSVKGDEQTVIAENVAATSYQATLPANGTYSFIVVPFSCGVEGLPAQSNTVTLQGVETLPYECGFGDDEGGTLWTIVNNGSANTGWSIVDGYSYQQLNGKFAQFKTAGSATFPAADWLISPAIHCPAGKYKLTYYACGGSYDTHSYKVFLGANSTDPAQFTKQIYSLDNEKVYDADAADLKNYVLVSVDFEITETGDYRLGYEGIGAATYATLRIDSIKLECTEYTGIDSIDADSAADGRMYDLMGREIRNPLPGTIYIQNGEKHIAR